MNDQFNDKLPIESDSQKIGRLAGKALIANIPTSWIHTDLGGTGDFGYDYQIQVEDSALVTDSFRIQLKGSQEPSLDAARTRYSVSINIATANYYSRAIEPILLVLCDLSVDIANPKNCPLYYVWIQDDLRRLREIGGHDEKKSITLHVPLANVLDGSMNVSNYIAEYRAYSRIGRGLSDAIESNYPDRVRSDHIDVSSKIVQNLITKSPALIDALADEHQSSWVNAAVGTLRWHLQEASDALRTGGGEECQVLLESAEKLLENAKPLEKADYWLTVGRHKTFLLDEVAAKDAFRTACTFSEYGDAYVVPWAEAELRLRFDEAKPTDFSDVIALLTSDKPVVVATKARLIAAEGKYDEAIAVTDSIHGVERHFARSIIFTMQGRTNDSLQECNLGLAIQPLRPPAKQLFLMFRARANFYKAVNLNLGVGDNDVQFPLSGPAGVDTNLLQNVWQDLAKALPYLSSAGWPQNVDMVADIWCATAIMLGLHKQALPLLKAAANTRPTLLSLQAALESMALRCADFELALEANLRLPENRRLLQQRICLLHAINRHDECVTTMQTKWDSMADSSPLFASAISMAILSAERAFQQDLADQWRAELQSREEFKHHSILFEFHHRILNEPLAESAAVDDLIRKYDELGQPPFIGAHLIKALDVHKAEHARVAIAVAEKLKQSVLLDLNDLLLTAQALATLENWNELLSLSIDAQKRFPDNDRLMFVQSIALDRLGKSADAFAILTEITNRPSPDELALSAYIDIASRSGFIEQAIAALQKIYEIENDQSKKFRCLCNLFHSIYQHKPDDPRLSSIVWEIGKTANREDERQEGIFLHLVLSLDLNGQSEGSVEKANELRNRIEAFSTTFPNSKVFRRVFLPEKCTAADLINAMREVLGTDDVDGKMRKKLERQLIDGVAHFPFVWLPRYVLSEFADLPTLWEASKTSSWASRQLHLMMVGNDWMPTGFQQMQHKVPLFDLLSLMVVFDLDLIEPLFKLFPKIAVGKATLTILRNLQAPLSACWQLNKIRAIQNMLKDHFEQIEQPEGVPQIEEHKSPLFWGNGEILEIAKNDRYLLYSDDALFRLYSEMQGICTLDLLHTLHDRGVLSADEVAARLAKLCAWRVGVHISTKFQISILPARLDEEKNVNDAVDLINRDTHCNSLFRALWNPDKPFNVLLAHGAAITRALIDNPKNPELCISAFACFWFDKVRFFKQAPPLIEITCGNLIACAAKGNDNLTQQSAHTLWNVYRAMVEHGYGKYMDDDKYNASIRKVGEIAALVDKNSNDGALKSMLALGLTKDTSDYDLFVAGYNSNPKGVELVFN